MKEKALLISVLISAAMACAQNVNVQKTATTNAITGNLDIGTGKTLTIDNAGTLAVGDTTPGKITHGTNAGDVNITPGGSTPGIAALNLIQGLAVTYTGTPISPLTFGMVTPLIQVPVTAGSGTSTVFTPILGVSANNINYTENSAAVAGGGTGGIATISMDNLITSAGGISFSGANLLTSFSCPVLTDTAQGGSIDVSSNQIMTTVSFPNLVTCGGNLSCGINAALTTYSFPNLTRIRQTLNPATLPLLTTLSCPNLISIGGQFNPNTMAALTTLSFPALVFIGSSGSNGFNPGVMNAVTTFSFPALKYVAGAFTPSTMALLTTMDVPELLQVGFITRDAPLVASTNGPYNFAPTTMAALTSLTANKLTYIGGNFAPTTMASLTTLQCNLLTTITGTFAPTTLGSLTALSFPALQTIGGAASAASMASLTTISFPAMITYSSTLTFNSSLGNVTTMTLGTIGTLKAVTGATINVSGQKLNAASVNAVLALLVSLDGTGGTTTWGAGKTLNISGGTSAAPSGAGITDKATLIGRGATVTTN